MKTEFQFFLPMKKIPRTTSQQKGINFDTKTVFTKDEVLQIRALFKNLLAAHVPEKPITGPVQVLTKWCYPTKTESKWGNWKHTKPDVGNAVKLFHDVMEELGYFANDSQIASEINQKFWTDPLHGGIFVAIEKLNSKG